MLSLHMQWLHILVARRVLHEGLLVALCTTGAQCFGFCVNCWY